MNSKHYEDSEARRADSPTHEGEALKPCPHCGNEAKLSDDIMWSVECTDKDGCGAFVCFLPSDKSRVIAAWNRRPAPVTEVEGEQPVAWACEADIVWLAKLGHKGADLSICVEPRPDLGMKFPLYSAASLARVTAERDEAIKNADKVCDNYAAENQRLHDRATAAEARAARLEEALKEFAEPRNWVVNGRFDPHSGNFDATTFARRALSAPRQPGEATPVDGATVNLCADAAALHKFNSCTCPDLRTDDNHDPGCPTQKVVDICRSIRALATPVDGGA